ncbi:acetyl-CoA carboxylase biotin carboxyl carrier protein [Novisyntrophococcus fermenticellae]|uniref:acetyl-CoA carboxylase biotin carboxyl carrier protein n=1 Tax=Novisyntrophococcus fermenticellae TaxID=2068655 RepID=UPI001E31EF78|nr:acetyl-CoA carboxylase biotin carboxyl carrier protein [Novisyntrophococcus fermenticellae]
MDFEQIIKLIDKVSASNLSSFQYESEGLKLSLESGKVIQNTVSVPVNVMSDQISEVPADKAKAEGDLVKSPLVGTFYAAPSEDSEPFASVGDKVKKGQVLAIVEAMKLMNDIESDFDGMIAEVYVKNGETVEYGQPLFRIV